MNSLRKELEEGKEYQFKVIKHVEQTHSSPFWILEDPFGKRHVLRSKYYQTYDIKAGNDIKVRVTYISCTGKVTLEPEHPYYKVGAVHDFKFLKHDYRIVSNGEQQPVLMVADKYGNECAVYAKEAIEFEDDHQPETIKCRVKGLKNGALDLDPLINS